MNIEPPLPEVVLAFLQRVLIQDRDPAFLVTDRNGVLIESGGNLTAYGLQNVRPGDPLSGQADFVEGLLPLESQEISLPCIEIAPQTFADIHCFRDNDRDFILLIDVTSFGSRQALLQQKTNDLKLLRGKHTNFTQLIRDLDMVFLIKADDIRFYLLGEAPEWIEYCGLQFVAEENQYHVSGKLNFLYNFVTSAEEDVQSTERLKSGPWVETDPAGNEWYFEATAMRRGKDKIVMIERLAPYSEPRFAMLQKAREQSLEYLDLVKKERLLREKDSRNRILLNAVPDWIFKINRDGIILDLKATMGKNPLMFAEFLRKPLSEIFPEEAADKMIECAGLALVAKTLQTCVFPLGPEEASLLFEARVVAISDEEAVLLVREMP